MLLAILFFWSTAVLFWVLRNNTSKEDVQDSDLTKYIDRKEIKEESKDDADKEEDSSSSMQGMSQAEVEAYLTPQHLGLLPYVNVLDLQVLLSRSDLCSEAWYEDIEDYITLLKMQNKALEGFELNEHLYELIEKQEALIYSMEGFIKKDQKEYLGLLEDASVKYLAFAKNWEVSYHAQK